MNKALSLEDLQSLEIFSTAPQHVLQKIIDGTDLVFIDKGDLLIKKGDIGDALYIVSSGRLAVGEHSEKRQFIVAEVHKNETVGEMALINKARRSADVWALRDSYVFRISKDTFDNIMVQHPELMVSTFNKIIQRLSRSFTMPKRSRIPGNIMIALAGREKNYQLLKRFADCFERELRVAGNVHCADVESFLKKVHRENSEVDDIDDFQEKFTRWSNELEDSYEYNIYVAEPKMSSWSRECIDLADTIILIADFDSDRSLNELEQRIFAEETLYANVILVLIHSETQSAIVGTSSWLTKRPVASWYHCRQSDEASFAKLVRVVTGHSIGLVLGGGGARGMAHLGVVRAMRDIALPVDAVGGTSIGAIVGAIIAMQREDEGEEIFAKIRNKLKWYRGLNVPLVSLWSKNAIEDLIRSIVGDLNIEDLEVGYFAVACDLVTGQDVVIDKGPLWRAIQASSAIPGIFAPVLEGKKVLVDGGVVNNLPVSIMRERIANRIIAVNIVPQHEFRGYSKVGAKGLSPTDHPNKTARKKLLGPNIYDIIMRSVFVLSARTLPKDLGPDCLQLSPNINTESLLDFSAIDKTIKSGYDFALPLLKIWQSTLNSHHHKED